MAPWQLLRLGKYALLFASIASSAIASTPTLIDIQVSGTSDAPVFEPANLAFDEGQEYLLVFINDKPDSITCYYDQFGQKVFTRYLQGTANVNQDSLVLPPNSKVLWHFIPSEGGKYPFYASNTSLNQSGKKGEIAVKSVKDKEKEVQAENIKNHWVNRK